MSIPEGYITNFETLKLAFSNGDVALMECQNKETKKNVYVLCAMGYDPVTEEYIPMPFAKLFDGNPFEELNPPNPDGGFYDGD